MLEGECEKWNLYVLNSVLNIIFDGKFEFLLCYIDIEWDVFLERIRNEYIGKVKDVVIFFLVIIVLC